MPIDIRLGVALFMLVWLLQAPWAMAAKSILFDARAQQRLMVGVDALANAVKVTLGPRGRNVAFDKGWGAPRVTKDGVTVAKQIELDDHVANLGAQMVREVAAKTADAAGDGTTTATVLTQAIVRARLRLVSAGHDPIAAQAGPRARRASRGATPQN